MSAVLQNRVVYNSAPQTKFGARVLAAVVGAFYAALLLSIYADLSDRWAYLGFWYHPTTSGISALIVASIGVLGLFLPHGPWRLVSFTKWLLYFALFVPALVIPTQQGPLPEKLMLLMWVTLWVSCAGFMVLVRDGTPIPPLKFDAHLFWVILVSVFVLGHAAILYEFRDALDFASLDDIYNQRFEAVSEVSSSLIYYILGNMANAVNPFLIIHGIWTKRFSLIVGGVFGQIIIYSTLAGKIVLVSTAIMISVYFVFKHNRLQISRIYYGVLAVGAAGIALVPLAVVGGTFGNIVDLIYMRTVGMPGVTIGVYSDFFTRYPVTYLSHSLVGRLFTSYPYPGEQVSEVVGRYITPGVGRPINYNANFIASDGITGFGIVGIPVIMAIAGVILWAMSKFVGDRDCAYVCAISTPFLMSLADSSIFTALLSGGGGVLMILLYLRRGLKSEFLSSK